VLAGGRSTRFGTADKLEATYAGMPLLHHAVIRVAEVTGDVVVVLAPDAPEPPMPPGMPVRLVRDPRDGEGPLAGAVAGLAHAEAALAVVVGGDMPELSTAVLIEMLRVAAEASVDAVTLQDGDRFRPLPAVVRTASGRDGGHALLHEGERALRAWLQAMRMAVIDEATWTALDPERATLRDVDIPADLDTARPTR
jgi:molybdopterin-guanine dinucleotide biosynthesis protein A